MIQSGTKLIVQDNSGGRIVECIRVLNKKGRNTGSSSDFLVVSVKSLRKKGRIKIKKKSLFGFSYQITKSFFSFKRD